MDYYSSLLTLTAENSNSSKLKKMAHSPHLYLFFLLLLFLIHCCSHFSFSSTLPDPYFKSIPIALHPSISHEYFELTKPFPSDPLNPSCHLLLLQKDFGNTIETAPVSVHYSPTSDCPGPWTQITLEFHATCHGEQYNWISSLWLDGIEILRISSLETTKSGIVWKVRKDVTRYSSLFSQSNLTLTMKLKNVVSDVYNGVYHVNVTLLYYGDNETTVSPSEVTELRLNRKGGVLTEKTVDQIHDGDVFVIEEFENSERRLGFHNDETKTEVGLLSQEPSGKSNRRQKSDLLYEMPADLIIPISDDGDEGFWFQIQNELDVHSKGIQIPLNTYRAVLEIYVSFHGNDEFWYSNPPKSYIEVNNLTAARGNGAFRQVFTTIDRVLVGSTTPFPVIYTGGINPMFSEPVVPIGALDLPSYDLDLTPFLGILLDGKSHSFGLGVTDSLPFWLVDANLHLWVDPGSPTVQANTVLGTSEPYVRIESNFVNLDGTFEIEAKRNTKFSGWVSSSMGNFTTQVSEEFEFKKEIKLKRYGQLKEVLVEQKIKVKTEVTVKSDTGELIHGAIIERKYPLSIKTSTRPGPEQDTCLLINKLSQALNKKTTLTSPTEEYSSSLSKSQDSRGWMVVRDHHVLFGKASTQQTLSYKDEINCYSRTLSATNRKLLEDTFTVACASSS